MSTNDDLDKRMEQAGMIPIQRMLDGDTPMAGWQVHTGMTDLGTYEQYLRRKYAEALRMQAEYELGDRDKNDELYDWTLGKVNAYGDALVNLQAIRGTLGSGGAS